MTFGHEGTSAYPRVALLFCLLLCGCGSVQSELPALGERGTLLECEEPTWDLRQIRAMTRHSHVFRIKNVSEDAVRLGHVQGDCGCIVARSYPNEIKPGEIVELPVTIEGPISSGRLHHEVQVSTASPVEEHYTLKIVGTVEPNPSLFSPTMQLDFGRLVAETETPVRRLVVARHDGSPVEFRHIGSEPKAIRVAAPAVATDRLPNAVEIPLEIDVSALSSGKHTLECVVVTSHETKEFAQLTIPVAVEIAASNQYVDSIAVHGIRPDESRDVDLLRSGSAIAKSVPIVRFEGDSRVAIEPLAADDGSFTGKLRVSLGPSSCTSNAPDLLTGSVEVRFPDGNSTVQSIPARLLVLPGNAVGESTLGGS